jgi:DNA-binding transcriptional ArsR family regulator
MWREMSVSGKDSNPEIFTYLKHPIRRRILCILSEKAMSFSELQKEFGIESSHLSYHIAGLGNLVHRTDDGKYALSKLGKVAFSTMMGVGEIRVAPKSRSIAAPKKQWRHFRLGSHSIPLWPAAMFLVVSMIASGAVGYYLFSSFIVPLQVKEPIEIVSYPSQWSLYPGETAQFNVTIRNHASLNYSVFLVFRSSDMTYQTRYLTFSDENYAVVPGQQDLAAWLTVSDDAPAANLNVTVTASRAIGEGLNLLVNGGFETGTLEDWNVTTGSCIAATNIVHSGEFSAYVSDSSLDTILEQSLINQQVHLTSPGGIIFQGWVYPTMVGTLNEEYPSSGIYFRFSNASTGQTAFEIRYFWSLSADVHNTTQIIDVFISSWSANQWNHLSRNVTADVQSFFGSTNLSDIVLTSVQAKYHFSNGSPGAFYIDDLELSIS